ncbi:uncharacterized protein Z518_02038 [Rhinocladiella mackenziei CBS 650.93]|uniref:Uncharacterized protein n=1 Tax=Rhinocladiella mackenziei CBS 650.93 TaxID=1442369 RepID=A0A0D2JDU6_9EURO|nr:uncharacterized protein Z518_02038 [Rhinocladiella mackenziei CBS 650.93]KIX07385.1 hypothetical protein Z518_02038 [Rhinocladiella mackenziei CBS 650.93]
MVIGFLVLTSIPTVTGVAQAISAQKTRNERQEDEKRMKKFHIDVYCEAESSRTKEIQDKRLVLRDDRVWIGPHKALNPCLEGYVAEAFYIEYPDNERVPVPIGLVSQVQDDPPLLNWIYVDRDTMELKYGNKSASIDHHVGPWDWTGNEESITFDEAEGFTAVEDPNTHQWRIYYDMDNDGLSRFVPKGRQKIPVSLERTLLPGA